MVRSDAELIEACLSGEQQAWHELVTRYSRLVYSIPRRKGFSADDADDVFQNVFTIVYRQLPNLRQHQSLPAWLITITQRQCIRLRKPGPVQVDLDDSGLDNEAETGDPVQLWERQHLVQQALRELDPRCRELLAALFWTPTATVTRPSPCACRFRLAASVRSARAASKSLKLSLKRWGLTLCCDAVSRIPN